MNKATGLITECTRDPQRLGVLAECMDSYDSNLEDEWSGHYLSKHTVAYSCGILARAADSVDHAHVNSELERCLRLSGEAARIMEGVYIGWGDESDHLLNSFCIPVNNGDQVVDHIDEATFRAAMRGTVYLGANLVIEPFAETSHWWRVVSKLHPDRQDEPEEHERVAKWQKLFTWFSSHPELHAPVYLGFEEPTGTKAYAVVYPKLWLALTSSGSLVGLSTCVVWT